MGGRAVEPDHDLGGGGVAYPVCFRAGGEGDGTGFEVLLFGVCGVGFAGTWSEGAGGFVIGFSPPWALAVEGATHLYCLTDVSFNKVRVIAMMT